MERQNRNPLAYGYFENGRLYYRCEVPYWGEYRWSIKPGYDIVNFSWHELEEMEEIAVVMKVYCEVLCKNTTDRKTLAKELFLYMHDGYMLGNSFLAIYYIAIIRFLVDQDIDSRMFPSGISQKEYEDWDYEDFVGMLLVTIVRQQAYVMMTLMVFLRSIQDDDTSTLQVFMRMLEQNQAFSEDWNTSFATVCRSTEEDPEKYFQMTELYSIWDVIRFSMFTMMSQSVFFTQCECCGNFFIPQGRDDAIYCDRPNSEYGGEPCSKVGAQQTAKQKRQEDPLENVYRKAYKRMYQRMSMEYISYEEYDAWYQEAKKKKVSCEQGEITLEEFEKWIDDTSRQKKKQDK